MLILAQDGIFPITKDKNGSLLPDLPASGFSFPGTIQGEGKLNGIPSLFIRLAGCNLHCCWQTANGSYSECDTAHASFRLQNTSQHPVDEICDIVRHNTGDNISHIVITGGEPFLQSKELKILCNKLKESGEYHLTIETNATLFDQELCQYIDLFSMSPKLSTSTPTATPFQEKHEQLRMNTRNINSFIEYARNNGKDFQLKFVYSAETDITEIKSVLSRLKGCKNEDILLMPLGANQNELQLNTSKTLEHCILNGWRYCDRLHISLFGAKHGV